MRDSTRHENVKDASGKRRLAARSVQRTRCDVGQATGSAPHATWDRGAGNGGRATCNGERAATTRKGQRASDQCNRQQTACNIRRRCNRRYAACNTQRPETMRHAAGSVQQTTCNAQRATGKMRQTSCNIQRTTNDMQRNRYHATDNRQRATSQHATDNAEKTTDGVQRTARNKATDTTQHAACSRRQTSRSRQQTTGNAQRAACNRHRATDSSQHARGREHMRDATGNTQHCRISCAARSGRHTPSSMREALYETTSAQLGADAAHKMQHLHTSCAAAGSKSTRSRQHAECHAMHEMRRSQCCGAPSAD